MRVFVVCLHLENSLKFQEFPTESVVCVLSIRKLYECPVERNEICFCVLSL